MSSGFLVPEGNSAGLENCYDFSGKSLRMDQAITAAANIGRKEKFYLLLFGLFILSFLLAGTWIACSSPSRHRRPIPEGGRAPAPKTADQILSDMKVRLNLSDEQEVQIRPIIEEEIKERGELVKKYHGQGREGHGIASV